MVNTTYSKDEREDVARPNHLYQIKNANFEETYSKYDLRNPNYVQTYEKFQNTWQKERPTKLLTSNTNSSQKD